MSDKHQIITALFAKGVLVTPTILKKIEEGSTLNELLQTTSTQQNEDTLTKPHHTTHSTNNQNHNNSQSIPNNSKPHNSHNPNKNQSTHQTYNLQNTHPQQTFYNKNELILDEKNRAPVKITFSYEESPRAYTVQDFVAVFNRRFEVISAMLRTRAELQGITAIRRLKDLTDEQRKITSIIGYVTGINTTKNGHIMLQVEDKTGIVNVLVNKDRPDVFDIGKQLVLDDIIGIAGPVGDNIVFANTILFPDIPFKEFKKAPYPVSAVFTSDLHFGGKNFLPKEFARFIDWINGTSATPQELKKIMQIKYLFIVGDLVEGVGIYPNQDKDLDIIDVVEQYNKLAIELKKIRPDIQIIACGGNHDAMRIAEPQPKFYPQYSQALYELDNFIAVSNPSIITIAHGPTFEGINVLMYHGYSFPYYFENVEYIRQAGGVDRIDLVMEFLLKRRHLAPTHTSTQYVPDPREDFLLIKNVPDIFATGHIHKVVNKNYKSVTMLNCGAWFSATDYQIKLGVTPDPGQVFLVDLQTRETKLIDFNDAPQNEDNQSNITNITPLPQSKPGDTQ